MGCLVVCRGVVELYIGELVVGWIEYCVLELCIVIVDVDCFVCWIDVVVVGQVESVEVDQLVFIVFDVDVLVIEIVGFGYLCFQ